MEFLPLVHLDRNSEFILRRPEQAVPLYAGIAVPLFPIQCHNGLEVGIELLLQILGRFEQTPPGPLLGVLHPPLQDLLTEGVRSFDPDDADLDLLPLDDVDVDAGRILQYAVLRRGDGHLRVEEPLFPVMVLEDAPGRHLEVLVHDLSPHEIELAAQRLLLPPPDSRETVSRQARHLLHPDDEVDIAVPALRQFDRDIAEQPLIPEVADGIGQPITGDRDLVPHLQSTEQLDRLHIGVIRTDHGQSGNAVVAGHGQVHIAGTRLCLQSSCKQCHTGHQDGEIPQHHSPFIFCSAAADPALDTWSPVLPNRRSLPLNSRMAALKWSSLKSGHITGEKCNSE